MGLIRSMLGGWTVPKPLPLELSDHERRVLRGWLRKQTASQALVLRSRIVLACAEGLPNAQVAQNLGISRETVRKWRARFAADRLEGLVDRPRSDDVREIGGCSGDEFDPPAPTGNTEPAPLGSNVNGQRLAIRNQGRNARRND